MRTYKGKQFKTKIRRRHIFSVKPYWVQQFGRLTNSWSDLDERKAHFETVQEAEHFIAKHQVPNEFGIIETYQIVHPTWTNGMLYYRHIATFKGNCTQGYDL